MTGAPAMSGQSTGPSVDARGSPVIDPTLNVRELVEASVRRIDDIVQARFEQLTLRIESSVKRNDDLREAWIKRNDDMQRTEGIHVREMLEIRAVYEAQLREKETQRIDAIRAVDVGAVGRASDVASDRAAALAAQVQVSAEALRNQVQAVQTANQEQLKQALDPIRLDIADLRKSQSAQQGAQLAQSEGKGSSQWVIGTMIGVVFFVISTGITIAVVLLR